MSVDQTQGRNGATVLKNRMQVSFNGISFTADDVHPASLALNSSSAVHHLTLVSWEQASPLSFRFTFSENTSVTFSVSDTTPKASLSVFVQMPEDARSFTLMYKPATGFSVTGQAKTRAVVSSKNAEYTMSAPLIEDDYISFLNSDAVATYARHVVVKSFTFDTISPDMPLADRASFNATVKQISSSLLTAGQATLLEPASISESAVTAYVAEMANQHRYSEALDSVPDSFKKGSKRTYISAPFFDSLVTMNASLEMQIDNTNSMVVNAVAQKSLDVFAASNISDFMLRNSTAPAVVSLVSIPSSLAPFHATLSQATGIIDVYVKLSKANSPLAQPLAQVLKECVDTISSCCKKDGDKLMLVEKDQSVSTIQTVETGRALIDYGTFAANTTYQSAGYLIVNSALSGATNADMHTLAAIYPVLVPDNTFYPHATILGSEQGRTIWAWSAAHAISYTKNSDLTEIDISIDFPQGDSHYLIIKGIPPFSAIDIYEMPFRTDPRFETYNSSGYVYNPENHTLFLKSRHKSATEIIRLHYPQGIENARKPAPAQSTPAESKQDSQNETSSAPETEYNSIPESTAAPESTN